jgi:hypothetical protein
MNYRQSSTIPSALHDVCRAQVIVRPPAVGRLSVRHHSPRIAFLLTGETPEDSGVVATEFHQRQGLDLSAVPRMSAADVVTASLRGLELGEVVCAPGVEDDGLLEAVSQADLAAFGGHKARSSPRATEPAQRCTSPRCRTSRPALQPGQDGTGAARSASLKHEPSRSAWTTISSQ